ncbi:MAG: hypothetical protein WCI11_12745 [Candidatus Methylumidiphilus sp.]
MSIKCKDSEKLIERIQFKYPEAKKSHPNGTIQTKFEFPCGLVVNVYPTTGVVYPQRDDLENPIVSTILSSIVHDIEAINQLAE